MNHVEYHKEHLNQWYNFYNWYGSTKFKPHTNVQIVKKIIYQTDIMQNKILATCKISITTLFTQPSWIQCIVQTNPSNTTMADLVYKQHLKQRFCKQKIVKVWAENHRSILWLQRLETSWARSAIVWSLNCLCRMCCICDGFLSIIVTEILHVAKIYWQYWHKFELDTNIDIKHE